MDDYLSPGQVLEPEPQPEPPKEWEQNLSYRMICPDCKEDPPNIVEDTQAGDVICESCGIVLSQRGIDMRAEWRTFANDDQGNDDPSRVGDAPNLLLGGNQLQTSIAFADGSARSKDLHRAQSKATADKGNKVLLQAFKQIGAYCDKLGLTQVVADGAKHIYKDAEESKAFKGKSQEALIGACLIIACRRNNVSRTFAEIHHLTTATKKDIGKTFKALEKYLIHQDRRTKAGGPTVIANGVVAMNEKHTATKSTAPVEMLPRYCGKFGLSQMTQNLCLELAEQIEEAGSLAGRSPVSVAAACIYMGSYLMGNGKSPKTINEHMEVSDSTIRTAYRNLYADIDTLMPPEFRARWIAKGAKFENLPKPS